MLFDSISICFSHKKEEKSIQNTKVHDFYYKNAHFLEFAFSDFSKEQQHGFIQYCHAYREAERGILQK